MFKISKRDIVISVVFLLVLIFGALYKFVYIPQMESIEQLELELEQTANEKIAAEFKIDQIPFIELNVLSEIDIASNGAPLFFSNLPQENLIIYLSETAGDIPIVVDSYSFTQLTASEISEYKDDSESVSFDLLNLVDEYKQKYGSEEAEIGQSNTDSKSGSNTKDELGKRSTSINFITPYEDLLEFMKKLEACVKEITISSMSISVGAENLASVSMTLDFYVLPKLFPHISDYDFIQWDISLPKGRTNPFGKLNSSETATDLSGNENVENNPSDNEPGDETEQNNTEQDNNDNNENNPIETGGENNTAGTGSTVVNAGNGNTGSENTETTSKYGAQFLSYRNPDFFLIVRPVSSGLPTKTIGYGPDTTGETYIRNYSEGAEDMIVELTTSNGEYFYRYSTPAATYPETGSVQFTPINNDIRFVIYSDDFVSDADESTVNLTIINETGLTLNWKINGDEQKPRVNVEVR